MEGTVFSSKTAEAKSLITELMGKKAEVEDRKSTRLNSSHAT